jgi:hypothetical protein
MAPAGRDRIGRLLSLLVAAAALSSGGCLVVAAGAAAGGAAAAGWAYARGVIYQEYPTPLDATHAAVRTSLGELQFPIVSEDKGTKVAQSSIESKTGDNKQIHIYLATRSHPIPAEGVITRVSIRVGAFGDDAITKRIFDQISTHLTSPESLRPTPAPTSPPAVLPASARPPETAPPPLAR